MHFRALKIMSLVVLLNLSACATQGKKYLEDYDRETSVQIPVSVTSFRNAASRTEDDRCSGWNWFSSDLGDSFHELAVDELSQYKRFIVLERSDLQNIYKQEVDLVNSSKSTSIERGQFQKAKYTISGVVNSFEYCAGKTNVGLGTNENLFSLPLMSGGLNEESATVEVTLRLIDSRTGKVIASKKGIGKQSRTSIFTKGEMRNFNVKLGSYSQSSLSDAIQEAIQNSMESLIKQAKI